MFNIKIEDLLVGFIITSILLVILQVLSTAVLPILGLSNYRLPFNILIILFLAFKLESPFLAIFILIFQYIYSFFSVEGWAMGVFAGILVSMIVGYLKDIIHFSSVFLTVLVTEIFQVVWFIIVSILIYLQVGNWDYIFEKLSRFAVESLVISLLAPLLFAFLDRVWKINDQDGGHSFRGGR